MWRCAPRRDARSCQLVASPRRPPAPRPSTYIYPALPRGPPQVAEAQAEAAAAAELWSMERRLVLQVRQEANAAACRAFTEAQKRQALLLAKLKAARADLAEERRQREDEGLRHAGELEAALAATAQRCSADAEELKRQLAQAQAAAEEQRQEAAQLRADLKKEWAKAPPQVGGGRLGGGLALRAAVRFARAPAAPCQLLAAGMCVGHSSRHARAEVHARQRVACLPRFPFMARPLVLPTPGPHPPPHPSHRRTCTCCAWQTRGPRPGGRLRRWQSV